MSFPFVVGELRWCPCCGQKWPRDADHELRAMRWMHEPILPFGITASNIDAAIHSDHDGLYSRGRDRFLIFELKKPGDDIANGQMRLLAALAKDPKFTVVLLQGNARRVVAERVTPDGLSGRRVETIPGEVRAAAASFVEGAEFRPKPVEPPRRMPVASHVCQWQRVGDGFDCTICGKPWTGAMPA